MCLDDTEYFSYSSKKLVELLRSKGGIQNPGKVSYDPDDEESEESEESEDDEESDQGFGFGEPDFDEDDLDEDEEDDEDDEEDEDEEDRDEDDLVQENDYCYETPPQTRPGFIGSPQ